MANNKQRYINTRFWNDGFISDLDPVEKLVFIYFLTNEHTNISGIYELPLKIMSIETGIEISMLKKIVIRLKNRVRYIDGKVIIKNFVKHQETGSPNVIKGILNCLKELDKKFIENLIKQGYYVIDRYYIDTLCIPYIEGRNYLDSNLDSNSITMSSDEDAFNQFWLQYPKKELKKKTKEIWQRKKLDSKLSEILLFVERAKLTDRWKKGFVKQPPVFLNGECWNDDISSYGDKNNKPVALQNSDKYSKYENKN